MRMIVVADTEDTDDIIIEKYYFNHIVFQEIYNIIEKTSYETGVKTSLVADNSKIVEGYKEVIDI